MDSNMIPILCSGLCLFSLGLFGFVVVSLLASNRRMIDAIHEERRFRSDYLKQLHVWLEAYKKATRNKDSADDWKDSSS